MNIVGMETDNFQTLSPGFGDTNSPESLFTEEGSRKRPFNLTLSSVGCAQGCAEPDTGGSKPSGFIINKPAAMESFGNQPDFSSLDQENPMGEMFPSDQSMGQLDFGGQLDSTRFQIRPVTKEDDDEEAQSQSDLSPPSSPGTFSPHTTYPDNTCLTLINQSEGLQLDDTAVDSLWTVMPQFTSPELAERPTSPKIRKSTRVSDASSGVAYDESEVGSVTESRGRSPSDFSCMKFEQNNQVDTPSPTPSGGGSLLDSDPSTGSQFLSKKQASGLPGKVLKGGAYRPMKKLKEPALNLPGPARMGKRELKILTQPEEQHRARYLTEGSRGAIKDRSQDGFPVVKLCGYEEAVKLQIFIGNDVGKVKPHGFYQACQVSGKNASQSIQKDIEGTTVIEMQLDPASSMTATVDCVGILKLRNADVEQRIGLARSKKKSTKARLVFRTNIPNPDGTYQTLQVASSPILCTQPQGAPEICKKSLSECSVSGGEELFIIGKNFSKGTRVTFRQEQDGEEVWSTEADVDQDYFQQTHMIVTVPRYHDQTIREPVSVLIQVQSSGRVSETCPITYLPASVTVKEETTSTSSVAVAPSVPMDLVDNSEPSKLSKSVSPVALEYNKMFQQATQKGTLTSELLLQQVDPPPTQSKADLGGQQQPSLKQELPSPTGAWSQPASVASVDMATIQNQQQNATDQILDKDQNSMHNTSLDQIMEVIQPKTEQVAMASGSQQSPRVRSNPVTGSDLQMGQQTIDNDSLNVALNSLLQQCNSQQQQLQLQNVQSIHSPAEQFTPTTPHTPHTPNFTSPPPEMVLQERKESLSDNKVDIVDCIGELNKLQEENKKGDESQTFSPEQTFQVHDQLNQSFTGSDYEPQPDSVPSTPRFSSSTPLQESLQAPESTGDGFRQQDFTESPSSGLVHSEAMDTDSMPRQGESVLKALLTSGNNPGADVRSGGMSSSQPLPKSEPQPTQQQETSQQQELTSASNILDELVQYLNEGEKDSNMIHNIISNETAPPVKLEGQSPVTQFEGLHRREQSMETLCSNDASVSDLRGKPGDQQAVFNHSPTSTGFTPQTFQLPSSASQGPAGSSMGSWASNSTTSSQASISPSKLTVDDFIANALLQNAIASTTPILMGDVQKEHQQLEQQRTEQQKQQESDQQQCQQQLLEQQKQMAQQLEQQHILDQLNEITQQNLAQQELDQQLAQQQHLEQRKQHMAQQQQLEQQKQQQIAQQQQIEQQKQLALQQQMEQEKRQLAQQQQLEQQKQLAQQQQMEQEQQQLAQQQQLEQQKQHQLAQQQQIEQQKLAQQKLAQQKLILQQLQQQLLMTQQKQVEQKQETERQALLQNKFAPEQIVKLLGANPNNGKTYAVATTGPQGQTIIQLIPSSQIQADNKSTPLAPKPEPASSPRIDLASLLMQKDVKPSNAPTTNTTSVFTQHQPIMANSTEQTANAKPTVPQQGLASPMANGGEGVAPTLQTVLVNLPASVASQPQMARAGTSAGSSASGLQQAVLNVLPTTSGITIITVDRVLDQAPAGPR